MIDTLIAALTRDGNLTVAALLLGNVAQALALLRSWSWHRRDRQEDRERWIAEVADSNQKLAALVEAITQLRILISQCSTNSGRAAPWR